MTLRFCSIFFILIALYACENVETGDNLSEQTVNRIKSLGLLDENEKIIKYYSNFEKDKAGNFFTNKRIAHYWLDKYDKTKNDTSFAFYQDIISIDTIYSVPDTFSPYMEIRKSNSSAFKVFIGGSKTQVRSFFEEAIRLWQKNRYIP